MELKFHGWQDALCQLIASWEWDHHPQICVPEAAAEAGCIPATQKAHLYLDLQKHYSCFNGSRTAPQNPGLSRQEWQQSVYGGGCANPASVGFVWAVQANVHVFSDMAYVEKSSTSQALRQQEVKYVLKMIKTLLTKTQHNKQIWLLLSSRIC